jgi:hypothetical protein
MSSIGVSVSLGTVLIKKWKICLILIASCFAIAFALGLYFHSAESFALDFSEGEIKRFIPLKKGDELKFYFKVPEDGFAGLNIRIKSAPEDPIFSIQLILRHLYKQKIVTQKIISSHDTSRDGFLNLRFDSLIFSRGSEFELAIRNAKSAPDSNLEFIILAPADRIRSLPTIYNTSVLEGALPVKFHFTKPLFIWRLLLNNVYIVLILTTILSFLLFRVLPETCRYHWAIFYFSVLLMLPTYVIISPDEEGFYNSLIEAILKSRAIAEGSLPFWNSFHGIGMPYNTMSSVNWHPIWLLLDRFPLAVLVAILYHMHVLIALFSMYSLARLVELNRLTSLLCASTYVCSTIGITFIFGENFWPSALIQFSLIPLIFFLLIKFLYAEKPRERSFFSLFFVSSTGFLILNCHLGTILLLCISLFFYLLMNWKRLLVRWPWVLLLSILILIIAVPRFIDLFEELRRYPSNEDFISHYEKLDFLGLFLWPFIKVERGLAFGAPFFLLSLISIFWHNLRSVHRGAFCVTIVGCYAIWLLPLNAYLPVNWGTSQFIIIFSALLAGLVLEQLLINFPQYKRWIVAFCFLQAVIVLFGAADSWHANARKAIDYVQNKKVKVLKVAFNTSPVTRAIETFYKGKDGRSYFTHEAEKTLMRKLLYGYHFESLPLNGFRILNGRYNGIDYSDIHPNRAYMKAQILGSQKTLFNKPLLDVLAIRYIFADLNETVPPGLFRAALLPGKRDQIIAMYINPTAWPDAVVVDEKIKLLQPQLQSGSKDNSLLSYDFRPLLEARMLKDHVKVKRNDGSITLMLERSTKRRIVMVSEYFRPGWNAKFRSSDRMTETAIFPLFGHLIGLEIPGGQTEVKLYYSPSIKAILWIVSLGTLIFSFVAALGIWLWFINDLSKLTGQEG